MVERVGVEPTVFLTCLIYSQVSSPLDIPLQNWVSSWIYTNMVLIQRFMLIAMKIFMFHCLSTRKYPITEHPPMRARLVVTPYTHIIWCHQKESNLQPPDYKSVALPVVLWWQKINLIHLLRST